MPKVRTMNSRAMEEDLPFDAVVKLQFAVFSRQVTHLARLWLQAVTHRRTASPVWIEMAASRCAAAAALHGHFVDVVR